MGILMTYKATKAYKLQRKGQKDEAIRLYEEAFAEGLNDARFNLAYALLIIRDGQYQKAKEFLVAHQKAPMTPQQRVEMLTDYAVCCYRLGNIDKGISTLEEQCRKGKTGLLYQTLGYLYVEKYDPANAQEEPASAPEAEKAPEAPGAEQAPEAADGTGEGAAKERTCEEIRQEGIAKAEEFIRESLEYDNEDPICLDNMGQFQYRVLGKKDEAKKWFEKAIAIKPTQIDTLYFLSRYDEEAGDRQEAAEKLEKALQGRFSPLNYCSRETAEAEIARLKGAQ